MNEEYPEEKPAINPIHSWLRVILWLIPISFLIPGVAVVIVGRYLGWSKTTTILLSYSSFFFLLAGAGWCDFKLAARKWEEPFNMIAWVFLYVLSQVILVTIVLMSLVATGLLD